MKRIHRLISYGLLSLTAAGVVSVALSGCQSIAERKDPISIFTPRVEAVSGKVTINGVDPNRPKRPFTWNWGDGHTEIGWFPLTHIYEDTKHEYVLTITAYYDDGQTGQERAQISFQHIRKEPISIFAPRVDAASGKVVVNGVDPNRPKKPFTWNWGDGHTEIGWFPLTHVYEDTKREYVLTVTAYYDDGQTGQERAQISFQKKSARRE